MIYCVHAISQVGTFGIQDAISYCVGNKVQTKNPEQGSPGVSGDESSGNRKLIPDCRYISIGIIEYHIHLHIAIPPKYSACMIVEVLKNAIMWLNQKYRFKTNIFWKYEVIGQRDFSCPRLA
jgi:hypothetical protein